MVELVIFDLDGTLLDTIDDLGNAANRMLASHGYPTHTLEAYRKKVGHGMRNLVSNALPEEGQEHLDECLAEFLGYYFEDIDRCTRPYPGIPELLEDLQQKGIALAVASNKIQEGTQKLVSKFFPNINFCAVLGNRKNFPLKPDAAVVDYILKESGVSRSSVVFVGDSGTDIATAHNAGIPCIAVSWGFRPRTDLSAADRVVDSAAELKDSLSKNG